MVRKFATGDPGLRYLGKAIEESLSIRVAIDLLSAATGGSREIGEKLGGRWGTCGSGFYYSLRVQRAVPFAGG